MKRYLVDVKRKWCSYCKTRRPLAYNLYAGLAGTCFLWEADTGMCGCSSFDPEGPKYPEVPCHGGYQRDWTCMRCGTTKRELGEGWVLTDKYKEGLL